MKLNIPKAPRLGRNASDFRAAASPPYVYEAEKDGNQRQSVTHISQDTDEAEGYGKGGHDLSSHNFQLLRQQMSRSQLETKISFKATQDWEAERNVVGSRINENGKRVRLIRVKKKKQPADGSLLPNELNSLSDLKAGLNAVVNGAGEADLDLAAGRQPADQPNDNNKNFFLKGQ